jgi:hypothetical protein
MYLSKGSLKGSLQSNIQCSICAVAFTPCFFTQQAVGRGQYQICYCTTTSKADLWFESCHEPSCSYRYVSWKESQYLSFCRRKFNIIIEIHVMLIYGWIAEMDIWLSQTNGLLIVRFLSKVWAVLLNLLVLFYWPVLRVQYWVGWPKNDFFFQ